MTGSIRFNLRRCTFIRLAVLVALVLVLGSTFGSAAADSKIIAVYFGMFDSAYDESIAIQEQIPWDKVNRVYIAFVTLKGGRLTDIAVNGSTAEAQERIRNLVTLCRQANPSAEIFIVSNYGGDEVDQEYLKAARHPDRFANSVLTYLESYGLDGFDMDWETRAIDDYADELKTLLSTTYATLKAAGQSPAGGEYKVTHTIWPGVHSPATVAAISDYVDELNLMTYGEGSDDDLETYASSYADAGVPFEKMIAGAESEFSPEGMHDTQESIARKAEFVNRNNLAGMYVWRMDNDMRTPDGETEGGPPTFQVTNWVYDALMP